ncbi:hypothetical protein RDI58_013788 [Solanum bulbocastanum]|uniref:Uncharacterized protein n=1 Tax=Solanum bulbocastanum TaxID=147425 RepID=A0AAN8YI31_SOLBU
MFLIRILNCLILNMVFIMQGMRLHHLMELYLFLRIIIQVRSIRMLEEMVTDLVTFLVSFHLHFRYLVITFKMLWIITLLDLKMQVFMVMDEEE